MSTWLIYGANGYTGRLCAEEAARRGMTPVLAGRRVSAVAPLATELGLEHRIADLADLDELDAALEGIDTVLHCAGPFSSTSRPMFDACLRHGANYLDITGEIAVFESIHHRGPEARAAGIVAIPGVGFDVVPTDNLAGMLAEALPGAVELELAIAALGSGVSKGTAKTAVEGMPHGGAARVDGRIVRVPSGWRTRSVTIGGKARTVVSIPWGDVSTAYYTTGIPNITTYAFFPSAAIRMMKLTAPVAPVLAWSPLQRAMKGLVDARVDGPDADQRREGRSFVWGRAMDAGGHWVEGHLSVPETYRFTVQSALAAVERVRSDTIAPGAHTPTTAFGSGFVAGIEGVEVDPITRG